MSIDRSDERHMESHIFVQGNKTDFHSFKNFHGSSEFVQPIRKEVSLTIFSKSYHKMVDSIIGEDDKRRVTRVPVSMVC